MKTNLASDMEQLYGSLGMLEILLEAAKHESKIFNIIKLDKGD